MSYYSQDDTQIGNANSIVQNAGDDELLKISQSSDPLVSYSRYYNGPWSLLKTAAEKEIKRRKEEREDERKERIFTLADTRSSHLLAILEKIADAIAKKPKTAIAIAILVPVTINILTSLLTFLGSEIWINILIPVGKNFGVVIK